MKQKKNQEEPKKGEIIIYEDKKGHAKLEVNLQNETVWLSQAQMSELFGKNVRTISDHVKNIYKEGELEEKGSVIAKSGNSGIGLVKPTNYYNLDVIISVGYRVKSQQGTQFRIWATQTLREYILKGYALDQKRIQERKDHDLKELEGAIHLLQNAMKSKQLDQSEAEGLLQVITEYANTWVLLQKYDEGNIKVKKKKVKKIVSVDYADALDAIAELKNNLIKKKEATDFFARERGHGLEGILGNIAQTFGGKELYSSIEEKAAHLLYFIIKDHPFVDGNKRSGAFLFILFLHKNNYLMNKKGEKKINDNALVALALLIAESKPQEKDVMTALVTNLLCE